MSVRFGPAVRLRSRVEFIAVQQHGRRVGSKYLTVLGQPNSLGRDRLGLIASRRVGGAIVRNRIKRRLREVFRQQEPDLALERHLHGWDIVVIARREAAAASFPAVQTDLITALSRLRAARSA